MNDIAEKLTEAIEAKEVYENARTKDVVRHYCPTCGEPAERYQIVDLDLKNSMRHTVKLLPCDHDVVWEKIQRVPDSISLADPDVLRRCAADRETVEEYQKLASVRVEALNNWERGYRAALGKVLDRLARGYGIQP